MTNQSLTIIHSPGMVLICWLPGLGPRLLISFMSKHTHQALAAALPPCIVPGWFIRKVFLFFRSFAKKLQSRTILITWDLSGGSGRVRVTLSWRRKSFRFLYYRLDKAAGHSSARSVQSRSRTETIWWSDFLLRPGEKFHKLLPILPLYLTDRLVGLPIIALVGGFPEIVALEYCSP